MRAEKRHKRDRFWLDVHTCFVLPAYTLLFAGGNAWHQTNFSVLAVKGETYYYGFLGWGLLAGGFFLVMAIRLTATLSSCRLRRGLYRLTAVACTCLVYGLAIPYLPALAPRYARLHVELIFGSCVFMMADLLVVLLACWREDRARYRPLLMCWGGIAGGSGLLFALFGMVSSVLEIFFTLSAALLVRAMWLRRVKE